MNKLMGLLPEAVIDRVRVVGQTCVPSLRQSVLTSTVGFTIASLAVYGSWALHERALYGRIGEGGAYAVWAVMFIALAGGLLNPVIIGPRTLGRFYALFAMAFTAYAVLWSASWFLLRGKTGEWVGAATGCAAMALVLARGFGLQRGLWKVIVVLFALHTAGYFAGGWLYGYISGADETHWLNQFTDRPTRRWMSKLAWGFAHGIGLGAGLGLTLHAAQAGIRERIAGLREQRPDDAR